MSTQQFPTQAKIVIVGGGAGGLELATRLGKVYLENTASPAYGVGLSEWQRTSVNRSTCFKYFLPETLNCSCLSIVHMCHLESS